MPVVNVKTHISGPPVVVWRFLCDIESYPKYMEDVRSVTVAGDPTAPVRSSSWSVLLRGSVLEWTEEDRFDHDRLRIDFCQIDGDLERFEGYWQIVAVEGDAYSSDVSFFVDFDIGIPLLANMLNPVAETSLRDNSLRMFAALDDRVTRAAQFGASAVWRDPALVGEVKQ